MKPSCVGQTCDHATTLERLKLTLELSGAFSYLSDLSTGEILFHEGLERLLGVTEGRAVSRKWWAAQVHPEDLERCTDVVDKATKDREGFELEYRLRHADENWIFVKEHARVLRDEDGRAVQHVGFVYDVTDSKKLVHKLERQSEEKDEFVAKLGHELRNPLASLSCGLQLLDQYDVQDDKVRSVHDVFRRQVRQLEALVDDLFVATKLRRRKLSLDPRPLDLRNLLETIVDDQRFRFQAKDVALELSVAIDHPQTFMVWGDPVRLSQAITNLLGNSLKFTPSGGKVWVRATHEQGRVRVDVSDSGPGVAPAVKSTLFEAFAQDPERAAQHGGLGLGLSIAKGIVEKHDGHLWLEDDAKAPGATFAIALPTLDEHPLAVARRQVRDGQAKLSRSQEPQR